MPPCQPHNILINTNEPKVKRASMFLIFQAHTFNIFLYTIQPLWEPITAHLTTKPPTADKASFKELHSTFCFPVISLPIHSQAKRSNIHHTSASIKGRVTPYTCRLEIICQCLQLLIPGSRTGESPRIYHILNTLFNLPSLWEEDLLLYVPFPKLLEPLIVLLGYQHWKERNMKLQ